MFDLNELSEGERKLLVECIGTLLEYLNAGIVQPTMQVTGLAPENVLILQDQLMKLQKLIWPADLSQGALPSGRIPPTKVRSSIWLLPLLKRAIIQHRRVVGLDVETKARMTLDNKLRRSVEQRLRELTKLTEHTWFKKAVAYRLPKLSDFVDAKQAQAFLKEMTLKPRVYDEKFGILLASSLFHPDLRYFRAICELRGCPVSIAFIDIDDFKEFNTKYGEPAVDQDILPKFMATLEGHVFLRGYAYRHGGDEYVVIFPNMSRDEAAWLLEAFQKKLRTLAYYGIDDADPKPKVSIGLCELNDDCILTESEGEERAARAKFFAKKLGKNLIASYAIGSDYKDEDIEIIKSRFRFHEVPKGAGKEAKNPLSRRGPYGARVRKS